MFCDFGSLHQKHRVGGPPGGVRRDGSDGWRSPVPRSDNTGGRGSCSSSANHRLLGPPSGPELLDASQTDGDIIVVGLRFAPLEEFQRHFSRQPYFTSMSLRRLRLGVAAQASRTSHSRCLFLGSPGCCPSGCVLSLAWVGLPSGVFLALGAVVQSSCLVWPSGLVVSGPVSSLYLKRGDDSEHRPKDRSFDRYSLYDRRT